MLNEKRRKELAESDQWYISSDTYYNLFECWDATKTGVIKRKGCVYYMPTHDLVLSVDLTSVQCKNYFGHRPKKEGLIYVEKKANGEWKSEKIDLEISDYLRL